MRSCTLVVRVTSLQHSGKPVRGKFCEIQRNLSQIVASYACICGLVDFTGVLSQIAIETHKFSPIKVFHYTVCVLIFAGLT